MRIFRNLAIAATLAALALPAFADMKAFNAAVKAGDYKTAAAEAKATWPTWNKADPDTATVAREFGFASYVAGDFAAAREYGVFLKDKGAALPTPDDQPETSAVLLAASEYRLGVTGATRDRLFNTLTVREKANGLDNVSVLASESLYRGDWAAAQWANARASAELSSKLLSRGGDQLAPRAMDAHATSAAAGFLAGRDKQDYDALVDAHDAIVDAIDAAADPKRRATLVTLKYQVEAWALAVQTFFESSEQIGSNIPKNVHDRQLKIAKEPLFESPVGREALAFCKGQVDIGKLQYPVSAEFSGLAAAVIVLLDFDASGSEKAIQILGAVPARYFADTVVQAAPTFKLKPTKLDKKGCRLDVKNRILRISFRIE